MNRVSGDYGTEFAGDQHIAFNPAKLWMCEMDIKILGSGCHGCLRLELLMGQVLAELGIEPASAG